MQGEAAEPTSSSEPLPFPGTSTVKKMDSFSCAGLAPEKEIAAAPVEAIFVPAAATAYESSRHQRQGDGCCCTCCYSDPGTCCRGMVALFCLLGWIPLLAAGAYFQSHGMPAAGGGNATITSLTGAGGQTANTSTAGDNKPGGGVSTMLVFGVAWPVMCCVAAFANYVSPPRGGSSGIGGGDGGDG